MLSEKTFKMIFNSTADGVIVVDLERRKIHMANQVFCEMTGYSEEEVKKLTSQDLHRKEDFAYAIEALDIRAAGNNTIAKYIPFKRKNDSIFYADIHPFHIYSNNKHYMIGILRDVTDRHQMEEKLLLNKTILETQLEMSLDGILVLDDKGKTILSNKRLYDMWHMSQEMRETKNYEEHFQHVLSMLKKPEEYVSTFKDLYENKEEKQRNEIELKDGRIFDRYSSPMLGRNGKILGRIWYYKDISDYYKVIQKLKESEESYRLAMEAANDALWDWNMITNKVYRNPRHEIMLGYEHGELSNSQDEWETRIHPDDKPSVMKILDEYTKQKKDSFEVEYRLRKKSGDYVWILGRGKVVKYDEKGMPLRMVGTNIDITERKKMEDELAHERNILRSIMEVIEQAVTIFDLEYKVVYLNDYAQKFNAVRVGEKCYRVFAGQDKICDECLVELAFKDGKSHSSTKIMALPSGEKIWWENTASPIRDDNGKIIYCLEIGKDITKQKKIQEELNINREKMAHAEQLASLGTLSATAAHELAQPLTVISFSIENAMTELKKKSSSNIVIKKLETCMGEVSNILNVVNKFRNLARKSTTKSLGEVDLKAIAEMTVSLFQESAQRANITLSMEGLETLPHILANEKDMEQLFFCLIENAIHAADQKEERRCVISGALKNEQIELRFCDNCGGIDPENLDRIFEPFFTTKTINQGTGLGLCIVQDIVYRAGGKIRVESQLGEGTTFFVTLPFNNNIK